MDAYDCDGTSDSEDDDPALQSMELESFSEPQGKNEHASREERREHLEKLLANRQIIPPKGYRMPTWEIKGETVEFRFMYRSENKSKTLRFWPSYSGLCQYLEDEIEPLSFYHRKRNNYVYIKGAPPDELQSFFEKLNNYCYDINNEKRKRPLKYLPSDDLCRQLNNLIAEDADADRRRERAFGWHAHVIAQWDKDLVIIPSNQKHVPHASQKVHEFDVWG